MSANRWYILIRTILWAGLALCAVALIWLRKADIPYWTIPIWLALAGWAIWQGRSLWKQDKGK